jgi:hypothetical protein
MTCKHELSSDGMLMSYLVKGPGYWICWRKGSNETEILLIDVLCEICEHCGALEFTAGK